MVIEFRKMKKLLQANGYSSVCFKGTLEQMDANVEAMARDLQEILRIGVERKRLWEVYKWR